MRVDYGAMIPLDALWVGVFGNNIDFIGKQTLGTLDVSGRDGRSYVAACNVLDDS